jgi:hypothetical protein
MGVSVCGDDSEESELFSGASTRNESEFMSELTNEACSHMQ